MMKLKVAGLMLLLAAYSPVGFSMMESDLTSMGPACSGRTKEIPQDVKSDPVYGLTIHAIDWVDIDADGHCDIVGYTQVSIDDQGEQSVIFFMSRGKRYIRNIDYGAGRTLKVTPIYLKRGGPAYLVIYWTESSSSLPGYTVRRWDFSKSGLEYVEFYDFQKYSAEKNNPDAVTVMLFYIRELVEKTTKALERSNQPRWVYNEIYALANTIDSDRYPQLYETLTKLSEKVLVPSH
jgi:hypothetical protein